MVVEDERGMRATLVGTLEDFGYDLVACETGQEALRSLRNEAPDVLISDLRLPDVDGLDILQALKDANPEAAFIVVTGYASVDTAVEALNQGAFAYITKPFNMDEVHSTVRNALTQQRLIRENRRLVNSLQEANEGLSQEVHQRTSAEEALQNSLERMEIAYRQATIYAEELREEIDQREHAEKALAWSEQLRRLQAAQEAKDQERKRLAEELHDETMAQLASVVVDFGFLTRSTAGMPKELEAGFAELRGRIRDSERSLRRIVQGIFPSVLTNLGLVPGLRTFFTELAQRPISLTKPLELKLKAIGLNNGRLPEDVEIAVYRVVQQAVTNALQHAQADSLDIQLIWSGEELAVRVADDGVGFDLQALEITPRPGHFGLVTLRDRIEGLDGSLKIESESSKGTEITARIPTPESSSASTGTQQHVYMIGSRDAHAHEG